MFKLKDTVNCVLISIFLILTVGFFVYESIAQKLLSENSDINYLFVSIGFVILLTIFGLLVSNLKIENNSISKILTNISGYLFVAIMLINMSLYLSNVATYVNIILLPVIIFNLFIFLKLCLDYYQNIENKDKLTQILYLLVSIVLVIYSITTIVYMEYQSYLEVNKVNFLSLLIVLITLSYYGFATYHLIKKYASK